MKFKYDITVIVPVYNNEKYIDQCVKSILNQNFDINRIQILLINDGSIDKSLQVLKKYESNNIKVIDKKNTGVSDTRNIGLKKAKGKYILFLDSDDYISKDTCKNLFNLFEKHYNEIDAITYPIIYDINGELKKHPRYSKMYYKGTNIYDLEKDYNLIQATVNVFIKNKFENNELFHTNQNFSEDERFNTELLMDKKKIGFCNEAIYYYRRHVGTANDTITNPYYSFETITSYYEYLFDKFKVNDKVPKYIQALYINNISWRIKQDVLYPYHYEEKDYKKALNRIKKLLSEIDIDVILSLPYPVFHKMYILNLKNEIVDVKIEKDNYIVECNNNEIEAKDYIESTITKLKLKDNILKLEGYFKTILYEVIEPNIFLKITYKNKKIEEQKLELSLNNNSYYLTNIKTNKIYGYNLKIDIKNVSKIEMYSVVNDKKINIKYLFNKFTSNTIYDKNIRIKNNKKLFTVKRNYLLKYIDNIKYFFKYIFKNPRIEIYRLLAKTYHKKNKIWLYNDKGEVIDNAYYQFKHDIKINDGIERYYVYNEKIENLKDKFTNEEMKYLVKFKSIKHKKLFLRSDKVLTSFSDLQVYCPFNNGIKWYRDITKYDLVYLQHGILHASLIRMYSREFTEIDKFVISTNFEKENLINKYNYEEENLILSGMSRMNSNKIDTKQKDKILFAPSWRKYLIGNLVNNKRKLKKKEFINSPFYKEIYELLHSKELSNFLTKNNLKFEFKLHPIFKEYKDLFDTSKLENISLNFTKTIIGEYKIFITDFSSFQFDFVKLKRPIVYFVPDIKEFKAGLHTYRELDLKYEDAFGKLCLTSDELLKEMKKIVKNKYNVEKEYKDRMDKFFINIDDSCHDIYKELKEQ